MQVGGYRVDVPRALLAAFALLTVGAFVVGGATSGAAFGAFNPDWEGTTAVRDIADDAGAATTVTTNTTAYSSHGAGTVAVVLAPEDDYDRADIRRIRRFLDRGGTLLVADRVGTTNQLLAGIGAEARLDGALLRDEQHHYRDPALPTGSPIADHPLTEGVDRLTFNYGTAVEPGNSTVLVSSSEVGYLDRNGNGELDDSEALNAHPMATTEPVSDGRVVVVGDASVFINVMAERPGNRQFARNVFSRNETVLIDTSHSGGVPPLVAALLSVRRSPLLQSGLVSVGLLALWGWQAGVFRRERSDTVDHGASPEALADSAAESYPTFDRNRLERLMKGIKPFNPERRDDE